MNNVKKILWGAVLIVVGVLLALDVFNVIDVEFLFRGWWTLFIIIPCGIGLVADKHKLGNLIGLVVGVALLLAARGIIGYDLILKLALPVAIIVIGGVIIFKAVAGKGVREAEKKFEESGKVLQEYCSTFSGMTIDPVGEVFDGASLTAIFGSIKLDLTGAVINEDAVIKVSSIFGGVNIILPEDVNVKISSSSIFGGISNAKKQEKHEGRPTVYINGSCVFGGCDVK